MKMLYLMRHAKSSSGAGASRDHERRLNRRGLAAATLVGNYMTGRQMVPQHILCSDAVRTQETLGHLSSWLTSDIPAEIRSDLYLASTRALLKATQSLPNSAESALVLGHNPGIQSLALSLVGTGPAELVTQLETKFPTTALAVICFGANTWKDVTLRCGELLEYVLPRLLASSSD